MHGRRPSSGFSPAGAPNALNLAGPLLRRTIQGILTAQTERAPGSLAFTSV
jgi:hypothetical protein